MIKNIHAVRILVALACWCLLAGGVQAADAPKPLKIFILAGQSNMEGHAKVSLLETQIKRPATQQLFEHLQKDGKWIERDDVWIKFLDRKGKLTVGYGSPNSIGPELEFGDVVGDHYHQPILLIKTAWGGRSLYRDFRSPSAGLPPAQVLAESLKKEQVKKPATTLAQIESQYGASYRAMIEEVNATLANLKASYPAYEGQGYEIAGFVWFQGWNDMINDAYTAEYATNLAHFIRDVRKDLKSPNLPFVIGQMGVDSLKPSKKCQAFKDAQASVAELPEFKGNVKLAPTDLYWDTEADAVFKKGWKEHKTEWDLVGSNYPFHYLGSVKTMCAIGKAFGEAMLSLRADGAAAKPGA